MACPEGVGGSARKLTILALLCCFGSFPAAAQRAELTLDLAADATLDPQLQWDTGSYRIYRNISDNLVTRDAEGAIVPQVATAWRYTDGTTLMFDLRTRACKIVEG